MHYDGVKFLAVFRISVWELGKRSWQKKLFLERNFQREQQTRPTKSVECPGIDNRGSLCQSVSSLQIFFEMWARRLNERAGEVAPDQNMLCTCHLLGSIGQHNGAHVRMFSLDC